MIGSWLRICNPGGIGLTLYRYPGVITDVICWIIFPLDCGSTLLKVPMKLVKKRFFGDRKLIASNKTSQGRALNQRVEIKLEKPF